MKNRAFAIVFAIASGVLVGVLGGCAPYVNIPAQRGDMATHSPNNGTVRDVMTAALTHVLTQAGPPEAYAVALPQRSSDPTYRRVLNRLPEGGQRYNAKNADLPTFSVGAVYVRGTEAQVDIVAPVAGRTPQLTSVYLELAIDGWWVVRDRQWTIPVAEALDLSFPGKAID